MDELDSGRYPFGPASPSLIHMRPQRLFTLLTGLALVLAACGGGAADTATPAESSSTGPSSDASPATTVTSTEPGTSPATEPTEGTTEPATERPAPDPNREIAPDFSLLLGDGSTFVLSEETRPVFMVFWAEW